MDRAVDTTTVDGAIESRTIWPREDVSSEQAMRLRSSSVDVQLVGTEPFWENQGWSRMSDIQDWVSDAWESHIEDGSGDYEASFTAQGSAGVTVPESELPDENDLSERLYDSDDYLQDDEDGLYGGTDSIVIVDYYGDDSNTYGWGYTGTAGQNDNICGLVDVHHEDNSNLPTELIRVKSGGVAFHELLHVYDSEHPDDVSTYYMPSGRADQISLMYSWDGVECNDLGNTEVIENTVSSCAKSSVRSYIDRNF